MVVKILFLTKCATIFNFNGHIKNVILFFLDETETLTNRISQPIEIMYVYLNIYVTLRQTAIQRVIYAITDITIVYCV